MYAQNAVHRPSTIRPALVLVGPEISDFSLQFLITERIISFHRVCFVVPRRQKASNLIFHPRNKINSIF